ncbi:MAG: thioesterase family protein, partial [Chitinophagales bacterium]
MFESTCEIKVRYGETDKMGVVYYGNYALYYEIARTEAMRRLGLPYSKLEERGIIMPVLEMNCRYKKAAKYDMLLTVKTFVEELPGRLMSFRHKIYDPKGKLLNEGKTKLLFVDQKTGSIKTAPHELI